MVLPIRADGRRAWGFDGPGIYAVPPGEEMGGAYNAASGCRDAGKCSGRGKTMFVTPEALSRSCMNRFLSHRTFVKA